MRVTSCFCIRIRHTSKPVTLNLSRSICRIKSRLIYVNPAREFFIFDVATKGQHYDSVFLVRTRYFLPLGVGGLLRRPYHPRDDVL